MGLVVSPPRSKKHDEAAFAKELAERAARIASMLDRWDSEDVSSEPDWEVEDVAPMTARTGSTRPKQST